MSLTRVRAGVCMLAITVFAVTAAASGDLDSLKAGKADLKSVGALAFGNEGILLVGDAMGGAIYALDTGDRTAGRGKVEIAGINEKIAAMLGTAADQIMINDIAVNPISKKVYLSISRGRGPTAMPVIMRVDAAGKIEELSLANIKHAMAALPNPPSVDPNNPRSQNARLEAITDLAYVDGRIFVAGLSNEEFASNLRSIPFPFQTVDKGTSIEMYHGSHARFETNSPVRTFVPYKINQESHILAAYTCTPIVKFPVSALKAGAKVMGTTIAELGAGNRPLDMIIYNKGGKDFILMNNSSRGVMKMSAAGLDKYQPITSKSEISGIPYETIEALKGVDQLDKLDDANAVILAREGNSLNLRTIALP